MTFSRRDATKLIAIGGPVAALTSPAAWAQPMPVRMALKDFVADATLLAALRKGVAAMKARKPSDPLSWFYQAAIHGVTDQLWQEQAKTDPDVGKVEMGKYWNQCPHKGENSANFLPWHRGYTYHFEQILRMHTGRADFALPYWDYSQPDQREFPKAFGIQHLDGNQANDDPANINPLYHAARDYFLCGYEHPFTDQLPLTELTARAVDASRAMTCPVFFGDTESNGVGGGIADAESSTRGIFEQAPHDQIHRSVGGNVEGINDKGEPTFAIGGMAIPQTAGFDPIFPVHHANMDRLWARWSCLPGKSWGKLPDAAWFDDRPWFFFDTSGHEVNLPRRAYFDRVALGVRFSDDDVSCTPLQLPAAGAMAGKPQPKTSMRLARSETLAATTPITASATTPTAVQLILPAEEAGAANQSFSAGLRARDAAAETIVLTLADVRIDRTGTTGFDVYLAPRGTAPSSLRQSSGQYLGPVSLFNHGVADSHGIQQSFDISAALTSLARTTLAGLDLIFVPYQLTSARKLAKAPVKPVVRPLEAGGYTIARVSRTAAPTLQSSGHHM